MRCLKFQTIALLLFSISFAQTRINLVHSARVEEPTKISTTTTDQQVLIHVSFSSYTKSDVEIDGKTFDLVQLEKFNGKLDEGAPDLPVLGKLILLPDVAPVSIDVQRGDYYEIADLNIAPVEPPRRENESRLVDQWKNQAIYSSPQFYPHHLAWVEPTKIMRGYHLTTLWICPLQYNPVTRKARLYYDFTVKVNFGSNLPLQIPKNIRTRTFDELVIRSVINPELHKSIIELARQLENREFDFFTGCDYLIITHDKFMEAAENLANWKTMCGLRTKIATVQEIGSTAEEIKAYIQNAYERWNPAPIYVLFLGDAEYVPTNYVTQHSAEDNGTIGTDLYYTTVDGDDYFPDLISGRIPVDEVIEANSIVNKIVQYEKAPIADENFYQNAVAAAYFQDDDDQDTPNYNERDGYEDRRFVLTSEEIRDFLLSRGYNVQRIYYAKPAVNPLHYNKGNYANGENLPKELLRSSGFAWDGDAEDISNAIENGVFMVLHRDHGSRNGWGDPSYVIGDVKALSNGDRLPVVFSINCATGWFDNETDDEITNTRASSECFVEAWIRNLRGGAVGVFGSTRISYSGYNDILTKGIFDAIWPEFLSDNTFEIQTFSLGEALNYGKLTMAQYYGANKTRLVEFEEFHYYGDPSMRIWQQLPAEITADFPDSLFLNQTSCTITAEPNCTIALIQNGHLLAEVNCGQSGLGTLSFAPISSAEPATFVIRKLNSRPLIQQIPVSTSGAALLVSRVELLDENQNGEINIGENISWKISLQNRTVSSIEQINLQLSVDDENVQALKSNCIIPAIEGGEVIDVDSLALSVANTCEPDHLVNSTLTIQYNGQEMHYPLNFQVKAGNPSISIDKSMIAENLALGDSLLVNLKVANSGFGRGIFTVSDKSKQYISIGDTSNQQWIASRTGSGNVFYAKENANLLQFKFYMNILQAPVRANLYLYEGENQVGTYYLKFSRDIQLNETGKQFVESGIVDYPLTAGKFYFLGVAWTDGDGKICKADVFPPIDFESLSLLTGAANLGGIPAADSVNQTFNKFFAYNGTLELGSGSWLNLPHREHEILPKESFDFPIALTAPNSDTTVQTTLNLTCESARSDTVEIPVIISTKTSQPQLALNIAGIRDLGNEDGIVNCNEEIILPISLKNIGGVDLDSLQLFLTSEDASVRILDSTEFVNKILSGEEKLVDAFSFYVDSLASNGHDVLFTVTSLGSGLDTVTLDFHVQISHGMPLLSLSADSIFNEADSLNQKIVREITVENYGFGPFEFEIVNPVQRRLILGNLNPQSPLPLKNGCGNIYFMVDDQILQNVAAQFEVTVPGNVHFYVYEGNDLQGFYRLKFDIQREITETGIISLESERINLAMKSGKFYYIGYSWNGEMKAFRLQQVAPISFSKFQVAAGTFSGGGFPPAAELNVTNSSPMLFYQTITIGPGSWIAAEAEDYLIPPNGSGKIIISLIANEPDTLLETNLALKSLKSDHIEVKIPVRFKVNVTSTDVRTKHITVPENFALEQNYPNPFNPKTTIAFSVAKTSRVVIEIYNTLGQRVKMILAKRMRPGHYEIQWDGTNSFGEVTASGVYIVKMTAGKHTFSRKLVFLK